MTNNIYHNRAFIDGQNLYLGTRHAGWLLNFLRFRTFLREKYHVDQAYYFVGVYRSTYQHLYDTIRSAGFTLIFRAQHSGAMSDKKGNVDTDIVFEIMRQIADQEDFDKVVLVSGDSDYYKTIRYLIEKQRFCKLVAPHQQFLSYLYEDLPRQYIDYLNRYINECS